MESGAGKMEGADRKYGVGEEKWRGVEGGIYNVHNIIGLLVE